MTGSLISPAAVHQSEPDTRARDAMWTARSLTRGSKLSFAQQTIQARDHAQHPALCILPGLTRFLNQNRSWVQASGSPPNSKELGLNRNSGRSPILLDLESSNPPPGLEILLIGCTSQPASRPRDSDPGRSEPGDV